jgi:hypothetical protein
MFEHSPICVDNYGESVYRCPFTAELLMASTCTPVGAIMPNVKVRYFTNQKGKEARKDSVKSFADSEANCNTCAHLTRVSHEKSRAGFLFGKCKEGHKALPNYSKEPDMLVFHPEDWMGMSCYKQRT